MSAILPRLLEMYFESRAAHRPVTEWRLSPDLYDRLASVWPERPGTVLGIPVARIIDLPPNSVVLR